MIKIAQVNKLEQDPVSYKKPISPPLPLGTETAKQRECQQPGSSGPDAVESR